LTFSKLGEIIRIYAYLEKEKQVTDFAQKSVPSQRHAAHQLRRKQSLSHRGWGPWMMETPSLQWGLQALFKGVRPKKDCAFLTSLFGIFLGSLMLCPWN